MGSLCFLSVRSKNLSNAALVSCNTTPVTIHCCLQNGSRKCGNKLNAEGVVVFGSYSRICRRCWASFSSSPVYSMTTDSFVTYYYTSRKSTFVTAPRCSVGVKQLNARCKTIKRERRFRFLGHILHILVDDGALFPFILSDQDTTSVH